MSAVTFYSGDEGWVVTNSTFTAAAKALAQKAGIKLIDGRALETGTDFWTLPELSLFLVYRSFYGMRIRGAS